MLWLKILNKWNDNLAFFGFLFSNFHIRNFFKLSACKANIEICIRGGWNRYTEVVWENGSFTCNILWETSRLGEWRKWGRSIWIRQGKWWWEKVIGNCSKKISHNGFSKRPQNKAKLTVVITELWIKLARIYSSKLLWKK